MNYHFFLYSFLLLCRLRFYLNNCIACFLCLVVFKESERKYRFALALRSRIEFLQNLFSKSIRFQITRIVNEYGLQFWTRVDIHLYLISKTIDFESFCEAVHTLYGDLSDRFAHQVPMPEEMTTMDITSLLSLIGTPQDVLYQKTVQILISVWNLTQYGRNLA